MNIKIDAGIGNTFSDVAMQAKEVATKRGKTAEFDFNGITCLVDKDTNLGYLNRYYMDAFIMEWKTIGPDYKVEYDDSTKAELAERTEKQEREQEARQLEWDAKDKKQREEFADKVAFIEIELKDADKWELYVEKNQYPYGKCCVDYARDWARLMQAAMANGETLLQCAERTSFELGFYGITGFMYGAAVSMLSQCWIYGEDLRKWHNKEYNHEGEGVVNPAILTLK